MVTVWQSAVLVSELRRELQRRGKPDFEPGERFRITPKAKKQNRGGTNSYRPLEVEFEFAAPKPSTAELLSSDAEEQDDAGGEDDGAIPF